LKRIPKTVRRTLVTIITLVLLLVIGGLAYVFITDQQGTDKTPTAPAKVQEASPLPKPILPAANAPEGAAVDALTSPVAAGENASITVGTNAQSDCMIDVSYNGIKGTDSGLAPKSANVYGTISWTWTVPASTPPGSWPIKVTCAYHGRTGVVLDNLQVTK
jgi:hypothetical protein